MLNGDIIFSDKRQARGKFSQQGSFTFQNTLRRPLLAQLRLYERMWRQDLTIKSAVQARTQWLLGTIGEVEHPDKEIAAFLNNNIKELQQENGRSWTDILEVIEQTTYWSGFSASEIMFDLKFGALYLKDILTYHPTSIVIHADKKGQLVHGKETIDGVRRSGIWQLSTGPLSKEVHLDLWKVIYLANESDYGNYYGRSLIGASYKWHRLKEALIDMMAANLDKSGNKMLWVRMPSYPTDEVRVSPTTGEEAFINSIELVKEQFEAAEGIPEVVFLPYQQSDIKPEIGSETLQDQVGDTFIKAIEYADHQSIKHIIPSFLLGSNMTGSDSQNSIKVERQVELFTNSIEMDRSRLCNALVRKVFQPLMEWNFSRASTKVPPTFARVYSDRSEDRVATMQMIKGLVESAVLNPRSDEDYRKIMQMLRLGTRERTKDDKLFIQQMLITPREKNPRPDDVGPSGSGSPGRTTGSRPKQIDKKETPAPAKKDS
jgi:hypothetical protein